MHDANTLMVIAQGALGIVIVVGGLLLQALGSDHRTPFMIRLITTGLVGWGYWFFHEAQEGRHDSPPALAMALLVAYVLVRYGRQIRGILEGEDWWPPNGGVYSVHDMPKRSRIAWWVKLNPWWLLFGNVDDGYWGDATFNPERKKDLWTAVRWWFRNPMHNLMFYGIGFADQDRMVTGRYGSEFHKPGGGYLRCWSSVPGPGNKWMFCLPFVSYISPHFKAYIGWRPSGAFGIKFNISRKGAIEVY
jgi:hypothetical protein